MSTALFFLGLLVAAIICVKRDKLVFAPIDWWLKRRVIRRYHLYTTGDHHMRSYPTRQYLHKMTVIGDYRRGFRPYYGDPKWKIDRARRNHITARHEARVNAIMEAIKEGLSAYSW